MMVNEESQASAAKKLFDLEDAVNDLARRTHVANTVIAVAVNGLRSIAEGGEMSAADALKIVEADIEALVDLVADSAFLAGKLRADYYDREAA